MLQLIFGVSGSGKSRRIRAEIAKDVSDGIQSYLLVPDQQIYSAERDILPQLPGSAGRTLHIVGFRKLSELVFRETGGVACPDADVGMQRLLMWQNLRELAPLLEHYHAVSARPDPTVISLMMDAWQELHENGIRPAMLERAADKLPRDSELRAKLRDFSLILSAYERLTEECFGDNASDRMFRLSAAIPFCTCFDGANVYVDSFTDFTEAEYDVLRAIASKAAGMTVTLCIRSADDVSPSALTLRETAKKISELGRAYAGGTQEITLTDNTRTVSPELAAFADELWDFSASPEQNEAYRSSAPQVLELWKPANQYAEAELIAGRIQKLHEEGIRFGEIAVTVRDAEACRGILDAQLEQYGIPCFLSDNTQISSAPAARFVLASLRCISRGFRREDVSTLVKTGLCTGDAEDADVFLTYIETWNLNGKAFTESEWKRNPDGYTDQVKSRSKEILERANTFRRALITPLERLQKDFRNSTKLKDKCESLYQYLTDTKLSDRLMRAAEEQLRLGHTRDAADLLKVDEAIRHAMTNLAQTIPDTEVDTEEFYTAMSLLLSGTEIGAIPALDDCVVIGSAATLRVENVRVSFLLGLNEGVFPASVSDSGLLNTSEIFKLSELGVRFGTCTEMRSANELYYAQRAVSKATHRLILSSPSADLTGGTLEPSLVFTRAKYLFPSLPIRAYRPIHVSHVETHSGVERLSDAVLTRVFDEKLDLSATSIRKYQTCPYRFFADCLLDLRGIPQAQMDAAFIGTVVHRSLERYLLSCRTPENGFHVPAPEQRIPLADRIFDAEKSKFFYEHPDMLSEELQHYFRRLRVQYLAFVRDITDEFADSDFQPTFFELQFGKGEDSPPCYQLHFQDENGIDRTVVLKGSADRVDLLDMGNICYVRVIDYKTGKKKFHLQQIASGDDLQLPLYLFTLLSEGGKKWLLSHRKNVSAVDAVDAAGAVYLFANWNANTGCHTERTGMLLGNKELLRAMSKSGDAHYLSSDVSRCENGEYSGENLFMEQQLKDVKKSFEDAVLSIAKDIFSGKADKTPSQNACQYCTVRDNCSLAVKKTY